MKQTLRTTSQSMIQRCTVNVLFFTKFGRLDDRANTAIGIVLILGVVLEINGFAVFVPCLAEGP